MGLHQTKKLLHSKGNHQKQQQQQKTHKDNLLNGKGVCKSYKGLIQKICKELIQLDNDKKHSDLKMGRSSE